MKKTTTYDELSKKILALEAEVKRVLEENKRKQERIEYLERMLFGSKRDKMPKPQEESGLFDDFFKELLAEKQEALAEAEKEIHDEAKKRRARAKKSPARLAKYQYSGLEERVRRVLP